MFVTPYVLSDSLHLSVYAGTSFRVTQEEGIISQEVSLSLALHSLVRRGAYQVGGISHRPASDNPVRFQSVAVGPRSMPGRGTFPNI